MQHRARRRAVAISLLASALVLAGLVALGFVQPQGPRQTLPDGTVLEYLGVTYGTHHERILGNWWQRTVLRFAEDRFKEYFPPRFPLIVSWSGFRDSPSLDGNRASYESTGEQAVVWFRVHHPGTMNTGLSQLADRTMTVDSHGCRVPCITSGSGRWPVTEGPTLPGAPQDNLAVAELPVFPRLDPQFRFGLYGASGERPLAEFTIVNPTYPSSADWRGSALPLSATEGGVTCTLEHWEHRKPLLGSDTVALFSYTDAAHPDRRLKIRSLTISDATGNSLTPDVSPGPTRSVVFRGLCPYQSAWKIKATLEPVGPWARSPDHVWVLEGLPGPTRNRLTSLKRTVKWGDLRLTVTGMMGAGTVEYPGGSRSGESPALEIKVECPHPVLLALRSIRYGQGHEMLPSGGVIETESLGGMYETEFDLSTKTPSRPLRIVVCATELHEVEMTVVPPVITPKERP